MNSRIFPRVAIALLCAFAMVTGDVAGQELKIVQVGGNPSPKVDPTVITGTVGTPLILGNFGQVELPLSWLSLDPGFYLIPQDLLADKTTTVGYAIAEGSYRVILYTQGNRLPPAIGIVTIGNAPTPPGPPVPTPETALQKSVREAFIADGGDKVSAGKLASVWSTCPTVTSKAAKMSEVITTLHASAQAAIADKLPATRKAISTYLNSTLGTEDKDIDAQLRATINQQAALVQVALTRLQKGGR